MEPFSLTCRSCAVKLKVANPQLIGQTLACPKCGTMIHVEHPTGWKPPIPDSVQSHSALSGVAGTAGGSNFEDIDDLLAPPSAGQAGASAKKKTHGQANAGDKKQKASPSQKRFQQPAAAVSDGNENSAPVGDSVVIDSPILPGDDWASKSARERKKLFLMIGSAVATVLVVAAIIFAIVKLSGGSNEKVVNAGGDVVDPQPGSGDAKANGTSDANPDGEDRSPKDGDKPDGDNSNADNSNGGFLDDTPTGTPPTAISQAGALDNSPTVTADQEPGGFAAPSIDDVPSLEVGASDNSTNAAEAVKPKLNDIVGDRTKDSFEKMDQKMGALSGMLADSDTSMRDLQDLSALLSRRDSLGMPKYSMEKPKPIKASFDRRLNLPIASLEAAKPVSLANAARLLTSLSGAPVSIDARQISMMGLPVNPTLDLKIKDQTSLEAAQQLAGQAGLNCLVGEATLGFTLPAGLENSIVELPFPQVGELSEDEKLRFVNSIKQLIAAEIWVREESPASASVQGDKIVLNCPEGVQRHVQLMIDRLNAAAVLLKDPSDEPSQKMIASRWSASESLRKQESGWSIGSGQTIGNFLNRIERLHGLTVVVDWQTAMAGGWSPMTIVPGELVEPTVGQSLHELAKSMGGTLVGIDATTVQLTSREVAATALDLEVYPCSSTWAGNAQSQEVEQLIFRVLGGNVESNFVRVVYEPKCQAVIVVAPQPLQRQIEGLIKRLNQPVKENAK